jgi:hypothetical protein
MTVRQCARLRGWSTARTLNLRHAVAHNRDDFVDILRGGGGDDRCLLLLRELALRLAATRERRRRRRRGRPAACPRWR